MVMGYYLPLLLLSAPCDCKYYDLWITLILIHLVVWLFDEGGARCKFRPFPWAHNHKDMQYDILTYMTTNDNGESYYLLTMLGMITTDCWLCLLCFR